MAFLCGCCRAKKRPSGGRAGDGTYVVPRTDLHADVTKMWARPFGPSSSRDAARLIHRVVVNNAGLEEVGQHRGTWKGTVCICQAIGCVEFVIPEQPKA